MMKLAALTTVTLATVALSSCADCGCGKKNKAAASAHVGGPRVTVDHGVAVRTN